MLTEEDRKYGISCLVVIVLAIAIAIGAAFMGFIDIKALLGMRDGNVANQALQSAIDDRAELQDAVAKLESYVEQNDFEGLYVEAKKCRDFCLERSNSYQQLSVNDQLTKSQQAACGDLKAGFDGAYSYLKDLCKAIESGTEPSSDYESAIEYAESHIDCGIEALRG